MRVSASFCFYLLDHTICFKLINIKYLILLNFCTNAILGIFFLFEDLEFACFRLVDLHNEALRKTAVVTLVTANLNGIDVLVKHCAVPQRIWWPCREDLEDARLPLLPHRVGSPTQQESVVHLCVGCVCYHTKSQIVCYVNLGDVGGRHGVVEHPAEGHLLWVGIHFTGDVNHLVASDAVHPALPRPTHRRVVKFVGYISQFLRLISVRLAAT